MAYFFRKGLRVLMYHRVTLDPAEAGALTVTSEQLREQMRHVAGNYTVVRLCDVLAAVERAKPLPADAVLVTFDDAYVDTLTLAAPVLAEFQAAAAVFVPTAYIGRASTWDADAQPLMAAEQLRMIAAAGWEVGLHSHTHRNFAALTADEAAEEVRHCREELARHDVPHLPALAYPYGGRPKDARVRAEMETALAGQQVALAFRIGGRVNRFPWGNRFEVNRIGVRGDRSLDVFRRKLRWGRLW